MTARRTLRQPFSPAAIAKATSAGGRVGRVGQATFRATRDIRGRVLLAIDLLGIVLGAYLALALRLDQVSAPLDVPAFPLIVILLISVRTTVNILLGLYSRRWRYASVPELVRVVSAATLGSLVAMTVFYGTALLGSTGWTDGFPRSFWPIELLLSVSILGGARFAIRAAGEWAVTPATGAGGAEATLLYGAGDAGVLVARSATRYPATGVRPVGFLDDNPRLEGEIVAGLRVYGNLDALKHAVASTGARALLITMPSAPGTAVRRVVDAAIAAGLEVRTVPSITELIDGSMDGYRVRKVQVEDLLRRPAVTEHAVNVEELIRDQVVMVTGGGGSIGSELARQVFALRPRRLVLVDRAESPLYLIQRELEMARASGRGGGEIQIHLANVASRALVSRLMDAESPDLVFHAAAYKHVPMMEEHPADAAHVNMGGTMMLLDAAVAAGVKRFVFVSTDKAVEPSSIMGASKRIGEMLVADTARRTGLPYVSVRFGNVLGSNGSVVPIFQDQLENGRPLTITDPAMTRYFMTIPEAVWLILDAAALGQSGDLFVLDMGEPVRLMDLAHDLIRLAGRDPNTQPIEVVGLRPGEKLHEELFYDRESVEPTLSPKVLRAVSPSAPTTVRGDVLAMLSMATGARDDELRAAIMAYCRPIPDWALGAGLGDDGIVSTRATRSGSGASVAAAGH